MTLIPFTAFKMRRRYQITLIVLVVIAIGLVAGRIYLPFWVTDHVNRQIAQLEGYEGAIEGVGISLWRGAYQIHGLDIYKRGGLKEPFVAAELVDFSVAWRALLRGHIVSEVDIYDINMNFAKSQSGQGGGFGAFVTSLAPFDINRLEVHSGRVAYLDYSASPDVNLFITDINGTITNLRNVEDKAGQLPSQMNVTGTSIGQGRLNIAGDVNILRDVPDFDVEVKLENAQLPAFNAYTREAAAIDFDRGSASFYSELAAADGHLTGYVTFIADEVRMINLSRQDSVLNAVWESLAASFMTIFKNHGKDQFALRVPIEGKIDNPQQGTWAAFLSIFSNAFGNAFPRNTDGNINFTDALEKSQRE